MSSEDRSREDDDVIRLYILGTIENHGRRIARLSVAVAAAVAILAGVYLIWGQRSIKTASLQFRPTFSTATEGRYPNELPFSPADITAPSVLDKVYDDNGLKDYCSRDEFRSSIFVDQYSMAYAALDAEYQARLVDPSLSGIQRAQLQAEYQTRRQALPLAYRLTFLVPADCHSIPSVLMDKLLTDVLSSWAEESESRRGVLNLRVQVLTPNVLDVGLSDAPSRLIRADLIRTALRRLMDNVRAVELLPGAALARYGDNKVSLAEVRVKIQDLIQARLEPLVIAAGRGMGRDSVGWVQQALTAAQLEERAASGRAQAYLDALREYSGVGARPAPIQGERPSQGGASDVQTLMPQIDDTFIDRIIEMSAENIEFRQSMTRAMVTANVESVDSRSKVAYYENLSSSMQRPGSLSLPGEEVDARLAAIVEDGKALAIQFNGLYEELSRVSLRPQAGLYQTTQPVQSGIYRSFTMRDYLFAVLGAFVVSLLVALAVFIVRQRMMGPTAHATTDRLKRD